MKKAILIMLICIFGNIVANAQTNTFPTTGRIGVGTLTPNVSALLEMQSTSNGLLIPRMTRTQRDAIVSPATGLMIFQTNSTPGLYTYSGTTWQSVSNGRANTNLGNLSATTAINTSLLPATNGLLDLGSASKTWKDGFFSGNVGIGTTTPTAKLDVTGNVKIADGTEGTGKVLTSDATGLASWQAIPATVETDPQVSAATVNRVPKWDGTTLIDGSITDNGNVGIGNSNPTAKLDVEGNVKIADGTQGIGKVLTSDANGLASWQTVSAPNETDPKVGSGLLNRVPKWNGTSLVDGQIQDNGNTVYIGLGSSIQPSAILNASSTSQGVLFPQVSIDSLKDVTSIPNPANGLIVYNTTQTGVRNDMARGYYYYSTNALSWVRLSDNLNDNPFQNGGLLGVQLKDKTKGVEILDDFPGFSSNWAPKVKILKVADSALLNAKNNITALVLTGVNRKQSPGWEFRQKTSIIFENNYLTTSGTSGRGDNVAISAYTENVGTTQTTQTQGLAFYVTAPPQNTATADTPSLAMYRHNVGIGAYPTDINNVTEGRVQITGFSNGDQLSLRHPSSTNLKWGIYVSTIDSSLNFYSNGSLRANIDRVTGVYSALSDRNLKKNIEVLPSVLEKINKLTPYIYNYSDSKDGERKAIGFMAQDVEPLFPDLVSHTKDRVTGKPFMMMTYQSFGVIAIKAIQEQQKQIVQQQEQINAKDEKIAAIESRLAKLESLLTVGKTNTSITEQSISFSDASLEQNIPNPPVNNFTRINYNIPTGAAKAELVIVDNAGRRIKTISLYTFGKGVLNVDTKGLASGTYTYTLYVDGKMTDTRKMVVAGR